MPPFHPVSFPPWPASGPRERKFTGRLAQSNGQGGREGYAQGMEPVEEIWEIP